jgi:hypothetical protein
MSDYGSVDEIRRKISEGIYQVFAKGGTASASSNVWNFFLGINAATGDDAEKRTVLPFVSCKRCSKVLSYDKIKGGTSHLRRHSETCNGKASVSQSTPQISNFFKCKSGVPLSVKQYVTERCAEFVCTDIRPFETISGDGFIALAQALIGIGVQHGQVSARDVIPHPTTVSRKIADIATNLKETVVKPELNLTINKWGGGLTTDMWTERFTQTSYITLTAHYITSDWNIVERVLSTREFDPELRHTAVNIKEAVDNILQDFNLDISKVVFVTDRGANVLASMKDRKHLSCCDHMINTVLTHLFDNKNLNDCPTVQGRGLHGPEKFGPARPDRS